jgi:phage terminase large subunit GpA-like protein
MEMVTERCGEIVLQWGAQLGKTELLLNIIGFFIDAQPSPILCVYPTLETSLILTHPISMGSRRPDRPVIRSEP